MVFTILRGCFSYANDKNVHECECTNGTYASYYDVHHIILEFLKLSTSKREVVMNKRAILHI